jgi:hypothetical protein
MNNLELKAAFPNISEDTLALNPSPSNDTLGRGKGQTGNKYHNIRTGHYSSRKEAKYAAGLALRKKAGEISFWLEQVPFQLPGGIVHRLDFAVFINASDDSACYCVHWIEVKGKDLAMGRLKRKQVEEIYGINIEVV